MHCILHEDAEDIRIKCFKIFQHERNEKIICTNLKMTTSTTSRRLQPSDFLHEVFNLVEVGLDGKQVELSEIGWQRESTGAEKVQNVSEHRSIAIDEEAAVLVHRRRKCAAEHGAEHRTRIARQGCTCCRVPLATDVQSNQVIHRRRQLPR